MKKILLVSLYYPPNSSPGAVRAKVFCQTLLENNIEPIVLTSGDRDKTETNQTKHKRSVRIERVKCIDALEMLSVRGRSLSWFALPDRWWPWIITGWRKGREIIQENKINLIMVTIPANSAAVVALLLAWKSGLPLIVDLRDPFRFRYDPKNVPAHFLHEFIERSLLKKAHKIITTTRECCKYYADLYPDIDRNKFIHIANGFDQELFSPSDSVPINPRSKFTLLHSGVLYNIGRDPQPLLLAIAALKERGILCAKTFELVVRGSQGWPGLKKEIKKLNIENLVIFKSPTTHKESILEMKQANALAVIQGDIFKTQIPSKLYDCLACEVPILVISKPEYATGLEAIRLGIGATSDTPELLVQMLESMIKGQGVVVRDVVLESRQYKSKKLVQLINQILGN